jgi:metal-sulfur cluster biosynthetic enzyme
VTAVAATARLRREAEVWSCLERVDDPELDEPITAMGFVERVAVSDAGEVEIEFRLPTYWCSPNFAFLMTEDIHRELSSLVWAARVTVRLQDHMWGEDIAAGVNRGLSFGEVFGDLADGESLDDLREKFAAKAFQRRQEAVLRGLRELGQADAAIVAMDLAALDMVEFGTGEAARQRPRYRALLLDRGLAVRADDPAFRTLSGETLTAERLPGYLAELRSVRINMEFNGALCRGLAQARYQERAPGQEPTLIDFMLGAVPAPRDLVG